MTALQREALDQAQDLLQCFPGNPNPKQPRDGCKPCACGKPDCLVRQREDEKPYGFRRRRYATKACQPATGLETRGALIAPLDWLVHAPPGRIIAQRQAQGIGP